MRRTTAVASTSVRTRSAVIGARATSDSLFTTTGTTAKKVAYLLVASIYRNVTLLFGRQEGHPACKKTERWGAGVVISLERGADLHMAQLMPLPLTVSCFSKVQIGFTFLVPAHPGSPGQRAVKRLCVCVCVCV